jgi:hypothetical protein
MAPGAAGRQIEIGWVKRPLPTETKTLAPFRPCPLLCLAPLEQRLRGCRSSTGRRPTGDQRRARGRRAFPYLFPSIPFSLLSSTDDHQAERGGRPDGPLCPFTPATMVWWCPRRHSGRWRAFAPEGVTPFGCGGAAVPRPLPVFFFRCLGMQLDTSQTYL